MVFLQSIRLRRNLDDDVACLLCQNGCFSACSFRLRLESFCSINSLISAMLWHGIYPPKVEIFVWQLLRGRVLVRDLLSRFGLEVGDEWRCPLCGRWVETIDHLFLFCDWSWGLWKACMKCIGK